jgi:hypothetical protein
MYGIGGFTRPLPHSHSWGLFPSGTALLILRFLWAILRGVLTKRSCRNLQGISLKLHDGWSWSLLRRVSARCPFWWIADEWLRCKMQKIILTSSRQIDILQWSCAGSCWNSGLTWEDLLLLWLSADSDLSCFW